MTKPTTLEEFLDKELGITSSKHPSWYDIANFIAKATIDFIISEHLKLTSDLRPYYEGWVEGHNDLVDELKDVAKQWLGEE